MKITRETGLLGKPAEKSSSFLNNSAKETLTLSGTMSKFYPQTNPNTGMKNVHPYQEEENEPHHHDDGEFSNTSGMTHS